MKKLLFVVSIMCSVIIHAQDVIVKKDGSTILSKVLEVNMSDIKYKKISNLNGPTYTIDKSEVLSINYENGEKDLFDNVTLDNIASVILTSDDYKINEELIDEYNGRYVDSYVKDSGSRVKWVFRAFKIHDKSIIGNTDGKVTIDINSSSQGAYLDVVFENTSNETIYIDLGSTSLRIGKDASTYYVNSAITTSNSKSGGTSLNLGAIASILGIGGPIGTIASGLSVNGGKSSGTSTTVYKERVITVAPHSKYSFSSKQIYDSKIEYPYRKDFKYGSCVTFNKPSEISDTEIGFNLYYAKEQSLDKIRRYEVGCYVYEDIPVKNVMSEDIKSKTGIFPLHYYYKVVK